MQEQKTATLTAIFSEVLANLAFMFTDEDQIDPPTGEVWLETTIGYCGPVKGTLRLWCTRGFSHCLAENLLGIVEGDDDAEQAANDAVKEFMNIVCGQFITSAYGEEDVFDLTIPQSTELPQAPDLTIPDNADASMLSVDGHLVQLSHALGELPVTQ